MTIQLKNPALNFVGEPTPALIALLDVTLAVYYAIPKVDLTKESINLDCVYDAYRNEWKKQLGVKELPKHLSDSKPISQMFSSLTAMTLEKRQKMVQGILDDIALGFSEGMPLPFYAPDIKAVTLDTKSTGGTAKAKHDFEAMLNALTVLSNKDFTTPEGLDLIPLDLAKKSEKPYLMARTFFEDAKQGLTAKEWQSIYDEIIEDVILSRVTGHESAEYQAIDNALRLIEHIKLNAAKAVEAAKADKIAALKAKLKRA